MRKNTNFSKPFRYNVTGIELYAKIPGLPAYYITHVRDSFNADLKGIKVRDQLIRINHKPAVMYSLQGLNKEPNNILPKQWVFITVLRDEERLHLRFRAGDIIGDYRC